MSSHSSLPTTPMAFFWYFTKQYPIAFAVFFAAPLLIILEATVIPYALKLAVDTLETNLLDRSAIFEQLQPAFILAGGAWIGMVVFIRLQEFWQIYVLPKFEANIRMTTTEYVMQHSYNYFANNLAGNIANKINDLPRAIDSLGMALRWNVIGTFGVSLTTITVVFFISPFYALIALAWIVIDVILCLAFVYRINNASYENAEDRSQLQGRIVDTITNIIATKLFAKRFHELKAIWEQQDREITSNKKVKSRIMWFRFVIDLPVTFMWIGLGYLLVRDWQSGTITTGDVIFIFNSLWSVMLHMWFLGEAMAQMFKDYGTIKQALQLVITPHDIRDSEDAQELTVTEGKIAYNDVSFHYNDGKSIFEKKTVIIEPNQKVGLVGFSGGGKTTFVNLILRFFDVDSGTISIDGKNIQDVTQESLRQNIAMIPQDTTLFHRSLMDNIRYGNIDASDKQVIAASKAAHCHEFIETLDQGYETLVGERGIKLSGGQRQRIAIARAMLKNAPILIMDEATSALDSITEKNIQESLQSIMSNRTTIVIAHRLSTLAAMDRILVFDHGKIIEDGTHESLLKENGHYARIWAMQAGGFIPDKE